MKVASRSHAANEGSNDLEGRPVWLPRRRLMQEEQAAKHGRGCEDGVSTRHAQEEVLQGYRCENATLGLAQPDKDVILKDAVRLCKRRHQARFIEVAPAVATEESCSGLGRAAALRRLGRGSGPISAAVPTRIAQTSDENLYIRLCTAGTSFT
jgi:hypothetical protein